MMGEKAYLPDHQSYITNLLTLQEILGRLRYRCERAESHGRWVHHALGVNYGGDDDHVCDLVTPLITCAEANYAEILHGLDWSCGSCRKIQNNFDTECCGTSAKEQLKGHLFALASLAMEDKTGPRATDKSDLVSMRELVDVFLKPHGREGKGMTPEGWKEPPAETANCGCEEGGSAAPGDISLLAADLNSAKILDLSSLAERVNDKDYVDSLLGKDTEPDHKLKHDQWKRGDYCIWWLDSDANIEEQENPFISSDYNTYPGKALVTKWGQNSKLNPVTLSQFPRWGLEGVLEIVDPNLTIPSYDTNQSKEGVLITLILYAHFVLDNKYEDQFRSYHPALKEVGIAQLARRLGWLRTQAAKNTLANLDPPCSYKQDFLCQSEAYDRQGFHAFKVRQNELRKEHGELKQAATPTNIIRLGADRYGRKLIRVGTQDLLNLVKEQHELGPFACKKDRAKLIQNFMERFKPDACGLIPDNASNAPTVTSDDGSLKRKRTSSQCSKTSISTISSTSSGDVQYLKRTPPKGQNHKVPTYKGNGPKRGGGKSSTTTSSKPRPLPLRAGFWRCINRACMLENPDHHWFCRGCYTKVDQNDTRTPSFTSTPRPTDSRKDSRGGKGGPFKGRNKK